MDRFSPKIEIINHFDNLINQLDIEIDENLEKCNQEQILEDLERIRNETNVNVPICFHLSFCISSLKGNNQNELLLPKSTKVIDYLNQVRERTLNELREAQKDRIEYFNSVSSRFKIPFHQLNEKELDEIKSQMFGERFYFQVSYKPNKEVVKEWAFKLFTIFTDFYMSPFDINILE